MRILMDGCGYVALRKLAKLVMTLFEASDDDHLQAVRGKVLTERKACTRVIEERRRDILGHVSGR